MDHTLIKFVDNGANSFPITVSPGNMVSIVPAKANVGTATVKYYSPDETDATLYDYLEEAAGITIDPAADSYRQVQGPVKFILVRSNTADLYYTL